MAKNRNTFIGSKEEEPKKSSQKVSKKKPKKKPSWLKTPSVNIKWLKDERLHKAFGLLLLLSSALLLIAFTSYLFTGNADQTILNPISELSDDQVIQNWIGYYGAVFAQKFIGDWFGIAAFIFVGLFFLAGFRILFKINLLPPKLVAKYSLFTLIWLPASLGFLFDKAPYTFLGGGVGAATDHLLTLLVGEVGSALILLFLFIGFIVINFNLNLALTKNKETEVALEKDIEEDEPSGNTYISTQDHISQQTVEEEVSSEINLNEPSVEEDEKQEEIDESDLVVENTTEDEPKANVETISSVDLSEETEEQPSTLEVESNEDEEESDELKMEVEEAQSDDKELKESDIDKKLKEFGEYDPTLDLPKFQLPSIDLLADHGGGKIKVNREELEANKNRIVDTLRNYKIEIAQIKATIGPTVTLYEIVPEAGVRISKIKNLEDDIALSLSALGIRIIAPIPGKGTIGIEVPNQSPDTVSMRTMIASDKFQNSNMALPIAIGKTISNETFVTDLAKMPHLLMAGATGQGKSVGLNVILTSLLYKKHPSQVKFVLVDPKKVELTLFNKIERHYLAKLPDAEEAIITDTKKVVNTLNSLCIEMDQRYDLLKDAMVRNIKEYNQKFIQRKLNPEKGHRYLPYIVLVIDEFADLIMTAGKEVETPIARLAQLARAIGIHLIVATQRPSVNVITGIIKANFPARIAFRVTSKIDSRTILDAGGADQLIGRGDLLLSLGSDLVRLQCAFVDTPEVEEITDFIGNQKGYPDAFNLPEYVGEEGDSSPGALDPADRDALFEDAARIVVQHQQGSASLLQRRLKLGYNRAGRIVDQLEAAGIIGPFEGSKARQVLIPDEMALEQLLNNNN